MENKKEEKIEEKKPPRPGRLKLLAGFMKGAWAMFLLCMACAALSALADMITPQIIRVAVDNVIGNQSTEGLNEMTQGLIAAFGGTAHLKANLWIMALGLLMVALVKVLCQYGFRVSNTRGSETLVKNMRDTLFGHISRLPFQWHMQNHTGDIIQRCTSDIDTMRNFISQQMTNLIRIIILLIMSLVFMLSMDPLLTLVALLPMPVIMLYSLIFHNKVGDAFRKCDENEGRLSAMAQENLTGVRVVRAFGREKYEKDHFEKQNEYYTSLWKRMGVILARFWITSDVLVGLQVMLLVVFGAVFCIQGRMTSGSFIAFISYNSLLVWPVRQLGRMISEMSKAGVSIDRVGEIMDAVEEKDDRPVTDAAMDGDIVFDHVTFGYDNSPEMLHDVSFTIPAGTTLGILGGTGSGKSTLMYLLDRLYPLKEDQGSITIGGVDIRDIRLEHLRRNIGIVLQEPFLFSRTLKENLLIADDDLTEEEMHEASRAACLEDTVQSFTKGYETFVGERGVTLSGGQKQRAAIARTLAKKTPILIFDDSLSAVDTETDAKIRAALEKRFGTCTVILISHRITTLSRAEQVLVLDKGRAVQLGSPQELKQQEGLYQKIYNIQSAIGEEADE